MRPEDWQRWLDSQFLDTEPPAKAQAPTQPAPIQPSETDVPKVAESPRSAPKEEATRPPATPAAAVEDADIPSFENYFPAFRKQTPAVEAPTEDVSAAPSPAPAAPDAAEVQPTPPPKASEDLPQVTAASPTPHEPGGSASSAGAPGPPQEPHVAPTSPPAEPPNDAPARSRSGLRTRQTRVAERATSPAAELTPADLWNLVPRHIQTLIAMGSDEGVQRNYKRAFKESRIELISRLLDPTLSLEDTARLLKVCPTTVRRYTNKGLLRHQRTTGDQRRFKLSDVLAFLEAQSTSREP